jgi:hypothetical protein
MFLVYDVGCFGLNHGIHRIFFYTDRKAYHCNLRMVALITRVAAIPSRAGMLMSVSTTAGLSLATAKTATSPFDASPTMSISGNVCKNDRNVYQKASLSFTSSTSIGMGAISRTSASVSQLRSHGGSRMPDVKVALQDLAKVRRVDTNYVFIYEGKPIKRYQTGGSGRCNMLMSARRSSRHCIERSSRNSGAESRSC